MKTLINKHNPAIRITAPEITIEEIEAQDGKIDRYYKVLLGYKYIYLLEVYWTLVDAEPVDLEKEIKKRRTMLLDLFGPMNGEQCLAIKNFARHFYELGLKARKEE